MSQVKRTIHMEAVLAKQKARRSIPQMDKQHNLNKVLRDEMYAFHSTLLPQKRKDYTKKVQNSFPK